MARYSGLLTPAALSADGVLDALWGFLNSNTAGGWTWAREGTTEAVYAYKDFGSGPTAVRRVVWLCGDAAGSVPGLLSIDSTGGNFLYVGAGRIAPGSFAWAGWKNAAPLGPGGVGRVHSVSPTGSGSSNKVEVFLADHGICGRVEGGSSSACRVFRAGALCQARSSARGGSATGDLDGLRTGGMVNSLNASISATWISTSEYGEHISSASSPHGWVTVNGVATAAKSRAANRVGTDAIVRGGQIIVTPSTWQDAASGLDYGFDTGMCGGQTFASATKVLSLSGVEMAYAWCRDSSGASTEAAIISAAVLSP